jgi:hypothetical protein
MVRRADRHQPVVPRREREVGQRMHRELPAKIPRTAFVSAEGLTDKGDQTRFDSESCREFGRRYAEAYLKLARQRRIAPPSGARSAPSASPAPSASKVMRLNPPCEGLACITREGRTFSTAP